MSRGRPHHQSSRRRMYSTRQRDLRERRSHQEWDAIAMTDQAGTLDAEESHEVEAPSGWGMQLNARASAA